VRLATPNRAEASAWVADVSGSDLAAHAQRARALVGRWHAGAVAVTLGASGALMVTCEGPPMVVPTEAAVGGDPCGAGDRFASTAAGLLGDGASLGQAVSGAVVAATAFVSAGGAGAVRPGRELPRRGDRAMQGVRAAQAAIARVRPRGGVVVAAGGCFDLLHAGHVSLLQAARRLGDCLVVCLNSDASVRRLKGAGRPLVQEADRLAVLSALQCVDAVVSFDEDTPESVLSRLRPDVFVKGGDYVVAHLPEAELLETWGGQAVVLPFLEGRSSSRLMDEAIRRAAR
jgi:rfaE bifunctional protein nucleotidyltransferase chain/domain